MAPLSSMEKQDDPKHPPCVWMQAGVVRRKHCLNDYDCTTCRYDTALRRAAMENKKCGQDAQPPAGRRKQIVFWKEKLKELPVWKQPCLHHLLGRINFRACTHEYRCGNCEFDQYFQDQYTVHAVVRPVDFLDIEGFKIPQGYYLHRGHTWVKLEEDATVRVGLDDFALRVLGPFDRIEAPLLGKEVSQGHPDIALSRDTHGAKVLSPVSGVITDINSTLRESGGEANQDPYSRGWVVRIHAKNLRQEIKNLMIGSETEAFIEQEIHHLYEVIEEEAGPLAADGGQLGSNIYGNMPELGWERLTERFLRT